MARTQDLVDDLRTILADTEKLLSDTAEVGNDVAARPAHVFLPIWKRYATNWPKRTSWWPAKPTTPTRQRTVMSAPIRGNRSALQPASVFWQACWSAVAKA